MSVCARVPLEVFFEAVDCNFIQFYISHLVLMEALIIDKIKQLSLIKFRMQRMT